MGRIANFFLKEGSENTPLTRLLGLANADEYNLMNAHCVPVYIPNTRHLRVLSELYTFGQDTKLLLEQSAATFQSGIAQIAVAQARSQNPDPELVAQVEEAEAVFNALSPNSTTQIIVDPLRVATTFYRSQMEKLQATQTNFIAIKRQDGKAVNAQDPTQGAALNSIRQQNIHIRSSISNFPPAAAEFMLTLERFTLVTLQIQETVEAYRDQFEAELMQKLQGVQRSLDLAKQGGDEQVIAQKQDDYDSALANAQTEFEKFCPLTASPNLHGMLDRALALADYSRFTLFQVGKLREGAFPAQYKDMFKELYTDTMQFGLDIIPGVQANFPGINPGLLETRLVDPLRSKDRSPDALLNRNPDGSSISAKWAKEIYNSSANAAFKHMPTHFGQSQLLAAEQSCFQQGISTSALRAGFARVKNALAGQLVGRYTPGFIPIVSPRVIVQPYTAPTPTTAVTVYQGPASRVPHGGGIGDVVDAVIVPVEQVASAHGAIPLPPARPPMGLSD